MNRNQPEKEVTPTVSVLPLRTPTLPPATHTNTVFLGREQVWIVDPATPYPEDQSRLLEAIEAKNAQGRNPAGIILTHHHRDHVGAAAWLSQTLALPVLAHPTTSALTGDRISVDRHLVEGDIIRGSESADDRWEVLHTPGHASDHLVLWQPESGAMIAGDMVAAIGTIVVVPPDGHMRTYIDQLRRLESLSPQLIIPSHGEVITDPMAKLQHYIQHRLSREAKVLEALLTEESTLMEVTARAYPELPPPMHRLASQSCLAHLIKLREEERAFEQAGAWRRRTKALGA